LWSVHSCFQRYKNYKNRPRNARVVVENNVAFFFRTRCIIEENTDWLRSSSLHFSVRRIWTKLSDRPVTWTVFQGYGPNSVTDLSLGQCSKDMDQTQWQTCHLDSLIAMPAAVVCLLSHFIHTFEVRHKNNTAIVDDDRSVFSMDKTHWMYCLAILFVCVLN